MNEIHAIIPDAERKSRMSLQTKLLIYQAIFKPVWTTVFSYGVIPADRMWKYFEDSITSCLEPSQKLHGMSQSN